MIILDIVKEMKDYLNREVHYPGVNSNIKKIVDISQKSIKTIFEKNSKEEIEKYLNSILWKKPDLLELFRSHGLKTYEDIAHDFNLKFNTNLIEK